MGFLENKVPITIINGFLGSGKTTLLNRILNSDHGLKIAVIVNDFGDIDIDTELLVNFESEEESTLSLANGCICCTLREELCDTVLELMSLEEPPEHIVIETSGVSDPRAVVLSLIIPEVNHLITIANIITVVDAELLIDTLKGEHGELALAQISAADLIILNKTDLTDKNRHSKNIQVLNHIKPGLRIFESTFGNVPLDLVFAHGNMNSNIILENELMDIHVHNVETNNIHEDHSHTKVFSTWSYRTEKKLSYELVKKTFKTLPSSIIRAKGVLYLDIFPEKRGILNVVGKRCNLNWEKPWEDDAPNSKFVLIGTPDGVDPAELKIHFDNCLSND